jgi:hypothetical protein
MNSRSIFRSLLTVFLVALFFQAKAADSDFFKQAPDSAKDLAVDKLYPEGRIFPFSGYSPHPNDYKKLVASGFTALGPVYGKFDEFLKTCEELKVKCMYQVQPYIDGKKLTKKYFDAKNGKEPEWDKIKESIQSIIKKNCSNPNIDWWVITPEELRFWYKNEYKYLQIAVKAIHEADPKKRPVYMYSPGHRSGKAMAKVAKYLDIIGKGCYTNYSGQKDSRIWVRWTMEQEKEAIKLVGRENITPILLPEMFQEPKAEELNLIPAWVRHDTYLGLISGAKGVIIFSLWPRAKFPSHKTYLDAYCKVASEINGKANLGQVFLFGQPKSDLEMKITEGPATASCKFRIRKVETFTYPSITFANIAYGKDRYLIAVNSTKQKVKAEFSGFPKNAASYDAVSGEKVAAPVDGKLALEFEPYEVKTLKFQEK